MNCIFFHTRRTILSAITTTTTAAAAATVVRFFSDSGNHLIKRPSRRANPSSHWIPPLPPSPSPSPPPQQKPNPNSNLNCTTDFTTICDLLTNPNLPPGPPLDAALDQTGIEPVPSLLQQIFHHFDSSPKPLFSFYLWAEKKPGYQFNLTTFNSMINALCKSREFDSAWSLINDRLNSDQRPNLDTFAILIRRYARAGNTQSAIQAFEFASNLNFFRSSNSETNLFQILLDSFCKEGHVRAASDYLDKEKTQNPNWVPSIQLYNILLNGWFRSRKLKRAERLWFEMKKQSIKPTVVTYGTLIEGLCRMNRLELAIDLIDEMKREQIEPNAIVYNPIIDALGEAGRFNEALAMVERFSVSESGQPTLSTYNSLVKGYCKAGDIENGGKILKTMISKGFVPTATTYNYFLKYFSKFEKFEEGLNLYNKMIQSGFVPDRLTYHLLIKMLCEEGRLDMAMEKTGEMRNRGFDLDLATSTMLIHLLIKLDRFKEAFAEFEDMIRRGVVPQYLTYRRLSDEFKKQGMIEMAEKLFLLMDSVPHSLNLPQTYRGDRDLDRKGSNLRKKSIIRKAEAVSDVLKECRDPRELVKLRNRRGKG